MINSQSNLLDFIREMIKNHGFFNFIVLVFYDLIFDFSGFINRLLNLQKIDTDHSKAIPTRSYALKKLKSYIRKPSDWNLLDIGCGSGSTLLLMSDWGFKKVFGVELDYRNFRNSEAALNDKNIIITNQDFRDYVIKNEPTVFYCYHIAKKNIESEFFKKIREKMADTPYAVIYHNNLYSEEEVRAVLQISENEQLKTLKIRGNFFYVFESNQNQRLLN